MLVELSVHRPPALGFNLRQDGIRSFYDKLHPGIGTVLAYDAFAAQLVSTHFIRPVRQVDKQVGYPEV